MVLQYCYIKLKAHKIWIFNMFNSYYQCSFNAWYAAAVAAFDKFSDFTFEFFMGKEKMRSGVSASIFCGKPVDSEPKIKYEFFVYGAS